MALHPTGPGKKSNFFDEDQPDDYSSYFGKSSKNPFDSDDEDVGGKSKERSVRSVTSATAGANKLGRTSANAAHNFFQPATQNDETQMINPRELYQQELRGIQERTLQTTGRSLKLIDNSEAVGTAAAEELLVQREQLENANRNLDKMDTTLDQSQKHINNIKSIFGGIKNWWTTKGSQPTSTPTGVPASPSGSSLPNLVTSSRASELKSTSRSSPFNQWDEPISSNTPTIRPQTEPHPVKDFERALDNNLDQMASGLSRLKLLATGLGEEIGQQNEILDSMSSKAERVDLKMKGQQKSMDQILGKKK